MPRRLPAADRNSVESIHYVDGRRRDDNGWPRWPFLVGTLYGNCADNSSGWPPALMPRTLK